MVSGEGDDSTVDPAQLFQDIFATPQHALDL